MMYVALLRGINVGGKNRVEMAKLKQTIESLGYTDVVTYINSGNVIFTSNLSARVLRKNIEKAIEKDFGFSVPVVIRSRESLQKLNGGISAKWTNDSILRTDVLFLWDEIDSEHTLSLIKIKPEIERVIYLPGALVWNIDRRNVTRGSLGKIVGTDIYKKMTIRNVNTLRKILELMERTANISV